MIDGSELLHKAGYFLEGGAMIGCPFNSDDVWSTEFSFDILHRRSITASLPLKNLLWLENKPSFWVGRCSGKSC